jgi:PAS domain S-box-containing protein
MGGQARAAGGFGFDLFQVPDETVAAELRINQSVHVQRSMPVNLLGNTGGVFIIGYIDWQAVLASHAIYFMVLQLALMLPMARSYWRLRARPRPEQVSKRRIRSVEIYSLLIGTVWGVIGYLLFPHLGAVDGVETMMILMFLCYGSVALTPGLPRAAMAFFIPVIISLTIGGFKFDVMEPDVLAILLFLSVPAVVKTVQQNFGDIVDNVKINIDRLAAEVQLRQQQSRETDAMRAMIAAIPLPLVVTRSDGTFEFSEVAAARFGVSSGRSTGVLAENFFADPQDQVRLFNLQKSRGRLDEEEVQLKDAAGNPFWSLISSRTLNYQGEDCWLHVIYVIEVRKKAEQALQESRGLLRAFADNLPLYISFMDLQGRYHFVNQCFRDWTAIGDGEISGLGVADVYPGAQSEEFAKRDSEAVANREVMSREITLTYPDGQERTVISTRFPVLSVGGDLLGLGTVSLDLTARKRIEEELTEETRIHQQTLDHMGQGLTMYDENWNLVAFNQRYSEHFDLSDGVLHTNATFDDVVGTTMRQDYGDEWAERLRAVRDPGRFTNIWRRKFRRPSGRSLDLLSVPVPGGGFIVTSTDVTALTDAEENLRQILESSPIGIVVASKEDYRRLFVNQTLMDMMGVGFDPLNDDEANKATLATWVDPDRLKDIYGVIEGGVPLKNAEAERIRPDGSHWWVLLNSQPTVFEGEEAEVIWQVDITERKRFEPEIATARDRAETALRDLEATQEALMHQEKMASLGQLTAGIAHELKNPLNFINNFALGCDELIVELNDIIDRHGAAMATEERTEIDALAKLLSDNLKRIAHHGSRADAIIRSMLDHSRRSHGDLRSVELNAIVEDAVTLAYHGARALDSTFDVSMITDFGEEVGNVTVDSQEIARVLLNLVTNAFYATKERAAAEPGYMPEVTIRTRRGDGSVEIHVRDNGIGMEKEIQEKLFTPFFTTKPPGEGTGLGLSLSYDIVSRQHGGTITVESKKGEYTDFCVRLPLARPGMDA